MAKRQYFSVMDEAKKSAGWREEQLSTEGVIFDIQRWSLHDGPGIRTNIFLKGCPLSCEWCSNPESQERNPELAYFRDKCIGCESCVKNCPQHALAMVEGLHIDYDICRETCYPAGDQERFSCTRECYAKALKIMGKRMRADQVIKEALKDVGIYNRSGGGITVTGGEPFAQPEFLRELLEKAKENHLHTAVETCLYAKWEQIRSCLGSIDFLFMDLKILDGEKHKKYTGRDNALILENMRKVGDCIRKEGKKAVVRTPVIPGINDTPQDIGAMSAWIKENVPGVSIYQLLPYHRLGRGKYENIGKTYRMAEAEVPTESRMKELEKIVMDYGLKTRYE